MFWLCTEAAAAVQHITLRYSECSQECDNFRVSADFPTHAYLQVFHMASCSPWHCRTAVGQFLGLLLASVSENICLFWSTYSWSLWLLPWTLKYIHFTVSQVTVYRMLSVPVLYWHCGNLTIKQLQFCLGNYVNYKFQFLLSFVLSLNVIAQSWYCLKIVPVSAISFYLSSLSVIFWLAVWSLPAIQKQ